MKTTYSPPVVLARGGVVPITLGPKSLENAEDSIAFTKVSGGSHLSFGL